MKFSSVTATVALFAALGFAAPATALDLAVDLGLGGDAGVSVDDGDVAVDVGLDANADASLGDDDENGDDGADSDIGADTHTDASIAVSVDGDDVSDLNGSVDLATSLVALIESSSWDENGLDAVVDLAGAASFDVDEVTDAESRVAVDAAIAAHSEEIEDLQLAVAGNAALDAWLQTEHADDEDVVAIGLAGDGALAVFVD